RPCGGNPKPLQPPPPPVLIGGDGPTVTERALEYGEGWIMLARLHDLDALLERVRVFHRNAREIGRTPIAVTLVGIPLDAELLTRLAAAGVGRGVMTIRADPFAAPDLRRLE